ncbi:MAG: hypothetical protein AB7D33_05085 [Sphingobium sp.]
MSATREAQQRALVIQGFRNPHFLRVSDKIHGGSKTFVKGCERSPATRDLIFQYDLFLLLFTHTLFEQADICGVIGFNEQIEKLFDLTFDLRQFWTCTGFVPVTYFIKPPWLRRRAG